MPRSCFRLAYTLVAWMLAGCGTAANPGESASEESIADALSSADSPVEDGRPNSAEDSIAEPDESTGITEELPPLDEPGDADATDWPVGAHRKVRTLSKGPTRVEVIIDKPEGLSLDALLVLHGTVFLDRLVMSAAEKTLEEFRALLDREDILLVSVAYPEEGLLFGDNVEHAFVALEWLRENAAKEMGISIPRIFVAGHSQGGYIATRLNTMQTVDGVVANAPGPIDLLYRCQGEESGKIPPTPACGLLASAHGTTTENPDAYVERSLLNFTTGHLSPILFVQGLDDGAVQMHNWPIFREKIEACSDCEALEFLEIPGFGHAALFHNAKARQAFNAFLQ